VFDFFNPQIQLFIVLLSITFLLPIFCHFSRHRFGLGPLFSSIGTLTFLFWQMRSLGWWLVVDDLIFNVAPLAFIPSLMSALVFCYAFDGIRAARSCWLILILTSVLAFGFSLFHHQLTLFSPVPSFFYLPLSSHYAVLIALFLASAANLLCYELLSRINKVLALVCSPSISTFSFLFVQSVMEYGLNTGINNFIKHVPEPSICLFFSIILSCCYALYCNAHHFFLPERPLINILLFWHKAESNLSSDELLESGHISSESRELNQQLSETQRLFNYHVKLNPLAVINTRTDGSILSANLAAESLFNLPSKNLLNNSIYSFLPSISLKNLANGSADPIIAFPDKSPLPLWHQYTVLPIYDAYNKCSEYQVIIKDVSQSQRSKTTKTIENNVRNIHKTSKMLSHDIANLLLSIEGSALQSKSAFEKSNTTLFKTSYDAIFTALHQGRALLSQLSDKQALAAPKLKQHPLQSLLKDSINIAKARASNKGITFDLDTDLNPLVLVDSSQIIRVFTNLLINAIRACDNKAIISILVKTDNNGFIIHFVDQGKGMSQHLLEHAFDPAFSTKGNGQGGLGLAISYLIIEAHGGHLSLANNSPDSGMTASIWLPAMPSSSISSDLSGLRLLLVCTDKTSLTHLTHQFDNTELDWLEVQNKDELFAMLEEESWDLLLLASDFNITRLQEDSSTSEVPCILEFNNAFCFSILKDDSELADDFLCCIDTSLE